MMSSTLPAPSTERAALTEEPHASSATNTPTLEALSWLLRYPLLRAIDLARLLGLSASAAAERLAQVRAAGLARPLSASVVGRNAARLYALTPSGLRYLAESHGSMVWDLARRSQADTDGLLRLIPRLPGLLVTQSFVLALITHAPDALCGTPAAQVMWSWTRSARLRAPQDADTARQRGSNPSLRCDASVDLALMPAIRRATDEVTHLPMEALGVWTRYRLVILWDSGLSRADTVRRQLRLLVGIRDAYERHGWLTAFPSLVVLAPDARRAHLWQAQALRLATERWLTHPLLGGALALAEASQPGMCAPDDRAHLSLSFPPLTLDALNPWRVAWYSFAQPCTQRLGDLLQPDSGFGISVARNLDSARRSGSLPPEHAPLRSAAAAERLRLAQLTLRLDARSLRLLGLLYLHPLLSMPQVAVALGVQLASADRIARHTRRLGLSQSSPWTNESRIALTDLGVLLLAQCANLPGGACATRTDSDPPYLLRRYQGEARSLARTPEHTAGVYSFFTALLQLCAAECAHGHDAALLWWETGSVCACAIHDSGSWHTIRPDGAGECRIEGQRFHFWLEWDRGTMGSRDLRAKFAAYLHFMRTGWLTDDADMPPPFLLLVTTTPNRLNETFAPLLREMRMAGGALTVWGTTADLLTRGGALGASWRRWTAAATGSQDFWGALRPAFAPLDIRSAQSREVYDSYAASDRDR